jgi:ubiquitin-protein ligase
MDTDITEHNTQVLMSFDNRVIRGRVCKELDQMYPDFAQITATKIDKDRLIIMAQEITESNDQQKYEFTICADYPFKPPKVAFQNRPYREFLQISHSPQDLQLFKQVSGLECLCCTSITCRGNWSPGYMMTHIIDEVRTIRKYRRNMIYKIIADKIKARHLVADIDLDSWLF